MSDPGPVVDNAATSRFELRLEGTADQVAFAAYRRQGRSIVFTHTEVPPALQGHGVGQALAGGALDAARAEGLRVVPLCPFIAAYIRRHHEYLDLVDESNRQRLHLEEAP